MAPSAMPIPRTSPSSQLYIPRRQPRGGSDPSSSNQQQQTSIPRLRPSIPRQRRSLSSLYDDDFKAYVHECSQPCQPIKEPWLIDPPKQIDSKAEAAEAYYYARYRLKLRYVTPRTKCFLEEYEHKLRDYLDHPGDEEKAVTTQTPKPRRKRLKSLRDYGDYGDYGDYVASPCTNFRKKATAGKVAHADILIGKSWGQVRKILEEEDEKIKKWRSNWSMGKRPETPMATTISWTCGRLGIDSDNVRYSIDWYSRRNENAHSGVGFYIKNCDWTKLGRQLWQDMQQIPCIFGKEEDQDKMTQTLQRLKDEYFDKLTASRQLPSRAADGLRSRKEKSEADKRENQRKRLKEQRAEKEAQEAADAEVAAAEKAARKVELARTAEERKKERKARPANTLPGVRG
ncbi:MAG: hypothetical protein Q9209_005892 [Squamulea sp. 1 TL-2023]